MVRVALCFILTLSSYITLFAQITLESEQDADRNVIIYAVNTAKIPYSIIINFSQLQNMTTPGGSNVTAISSPGRSKVATLKPTLAGQGTNYRYSYSFAKGDIYGKTKIDPIYLIPVAEGTPVTAMVNTNLSNTLKGETSNASYVGVSFRFENPTDIVAPRKGVVAEMKMDFSTEKENLNFSAEENYIEIFHEDGTITRLSVLKAGSEKVQVGDVVLPGQIIAHSGGENYEIGPHIRMINQRTKKADQEKLKYTFFPVVFASKEGNQEIKEVTKLTASHPKEVVTLELSKKELKQFQEGK